MKFNEAIELKKQIQSNLKDEYVKDPNRYNSVKEIKDELDKEVQKELSFEKKLMNAYPSLFRKGADGNILRPDCGVSCPEGWHRIVTTLCDCIDKYVKNSEHLTQKYVLWFKLKMWFYKNIISPILKAIHCRVDPYELYRPESPSKKYTSWVVYPHVREMVESKHRRRLKIANKISIISSWFRPHYKYNRQSIPPVCIDQVKEKFGVLRFYCEGGDDTIRGMIRLAEHMSSITCEITGDHASLCKKSKGLAWYKTLSPEQAKKKGYVLVNLV